MGQSKGQRQTAVPPRTGLLFVKVALRDNMANQELMEAGAS